LILSDPNNWGLLVFLFTFSDDGLDSLGRADIVGTVDVFFSNTDRILPTETDCNAEFGFKLLLLMARIPMDEPFPNSP